MLEKTVESPLDCKEIQPGHPRDQSWVFFGRTTFKLKLQYFGHLVESEKVGLKLNIQKTKIMASGPITSWEIDREIVEAVAEFIFWGVQNHCR